MSHFQKKLSLIFLDNLLFSKKSRRQFIFLCTPGNRSSHLDTYTNVFFISVAETELVEDSGEPGYIL